MGTATNFILVILGFCSFSIGIFVYKRKKLLVLFLSLGLLMSAYPFIDNYISTLKAYEWTIMVYRKIDYFHDPKVIFVRSIQWITDYDRIKRRRGEVRSLLLNNDTTEKEWRVKGYIPVSIEADIIYGSDNYKIVKNFGEMEAGSYTFTLFFDEDDRGSWAIEQNDAESHKEE